MEERKMESGDEEGKQIQKKNEGGGQIIARLFDKAPKNHI